MHRLPVPLRVVTAVPRDRAAKVVALESRRQARLVALRKQTQDPPRPTAA
jgi:hypothetical protein